jgi:hypothetical protein
METETRNENIVRVEKEREKIWAETENEKQVGNETEDGNQYSLYRQSRDWKIALKKQRQGSINTYVGEKNG